MRRWVVIGRTASASAEFALDDLASTSGRLDVLLRCVRAALLVSHGVRAASTVHLVLQGGPRAPRVLRIDAARVKFLRPDERSLATLVKKSLAATGDEEGFVEVRPGIAIARGGLDVVLRDLPREGPRWVLDAAGSDLRSVGIDPGEATIFVGDHLGLDEDARAMLAGVAAISIGPVAVHADDAITIVGNEMDRREGR